MRHREYSTSLQGKPIAKELTHGVHELVEAVGRGGSVVRG
jgi:hypothetical protein